MPTSRARESAVFIGVTLLVSWGLGALWLQDESRYILLRMLMCVPGVVGLACAWFFRRESPAAAGFGFTRSVHWGVAAGLPLLYALVLVVLAYALRPLLGPDFIHYTPEALERSLPGLGPYTGLGALGLMLVLLPVISAPWLLVALAVRFGWVRKAGAALPAGVSWLKWGVAGLLAALFVPFGLPGELGEEVGWRGYLVRRWEDRPLVALGILSVVWPAFHLPILFSTTQRGHVAQNVTFLLAIGAAAAMFQAVYLWTRSVWPCAVLHLAWNLINPTVLGNVYSGKPGLFSGSVWVFNGEGVLGAVVMGAVTLGLVWRWRARAPVSPAYASSSPSSR
ncbi:CPBP family intramembrane metalloprotease [Pyxidicoccus parkwayensis]|uniref:CPBP family intramembrane metalloprotease n=1 Tax=Pyxidicoccus parkwayensis TaxID=2813578 RepID=A0ABX7NUF8_9BACT|nr:CPBP family intramembrane glutamic endopeptidase [Pyxidicoccus parkwaysis]QSQ22514.1 CPBP family intramembrane metalloprotease [Pyxidicoccus parkwaysis]